MDTRGGGEETAKKSSYHHGHLREALLEAAHHLIAERGPEDFTLAEACRRAGVSTAAPYRHFADRGALIQAVAARGFTQLTERLKTARDRHPQGSVESIVSMGQAYVAFAAHEPAVFRLMFGRHKMRLPSSEQAMAEGAGCFHVLLEAVAAWLTRTGGEVARQLDVAVPLWTIVHGTSHLLIDRDFDHVAPGTDVDQLVARATEAFLAGALARRDANP